MLARDRLTGGVPQYLLKCKSGLIGVLICFDYLNIHEIYKHLDNCDDLKLVVVPMFSPDIEKDFYPKAEELARRHVFTVLCNGLGKGSCGGSRFFGSVLNDYKPTEWRNDSCIFGPPIEKNDHEGILLARFDLSHPEAKTVPTDRRRREFVNFKDPCWIELA